MREVVRWLCCQRACVSSVRAQAKHLFKLSSSKALKVYDFFVAWGWLPAAPTARQPPPPPPSQQQPQQAPQQPQQEQPPQAPQQEQVQLMTVEPSAPTPEAMPVEGVTGPAERAAEEALPPVKTENADPGGGADVM